MKIHLALATVVAQAATGTSTAVFPATGQHANYAIHDTLPQGRPYDETISLTGGTAASVIVSVPGKGRANVALDGGAPAHLGRSLGPGFHLLEVANDVTQAGLAGRGSVSVQLGPPNAPPVTLAVRTAGDTITASGDVSMPPPPPRTDERSEGAPMGPPPQGGSDERKLAVTIVATVRDGKLSSARGHFSPVTGRGPEHTWTVSRKP